MQLRKYIVENFINVKIEDAVNGIEALEKHRSFKPELIILDYILPPPDGLAVLKIISSFDTQVKIVVMTTLGKQKYIYNKLIDSGALAVFTKPITRDILLEMVSLLQKSTGAGENIEENSR
jgi:two-component system chemotaxis response regulator CheY